MSTPLVPSLRDDAIATRPRPRGNQSLAAFFEPSHVAVIGASATPGKLGHAVVCNLVAGGFKGRISAINPTAADVEGQRGYTSVSAIGTPVDCAFLAIPASRVLDAMHDCAAAMVPCVVIGASGFAELGTPEGRALQQRVAEVAVQAGMRVIGPNTNGLLNTWQQLSMGYNASHAESFRRAPVSILSHSGALFDGIAKRLQAYGGGLSKFVAVGNELDVSMLDLLDHLVEDPHSQVIGLVIEGLDDGHRLRRLAARLADAGKAVVVLKIGRSAAGAGAALAHSSRLAGNDRAWDALLKSCGFIAVRTVEALSGACAVLARGDDHGADPRLLCVTTSGAGGAILADFASDANIALAPQWTGATTLAIGSLPTAAPIRHPIDMGSLGDWALLAPTLEVLESDGYLGPMVVYAHVAPGPAMAQNLVDALRARRQRVRQPLLVLAPGGLGTNVEQQYTDAGIPVFHDTVTCFSSLAAYFARQVRPCAYPTAAEPAAPVPDVIGALLQSAGPGAPLSELQSARILRHAGVPMVPSRVVHDLNGCTVAAATLSYPVVLKAMVPGVAHKHQAGLVGVALQNPQALNAEFVRQTDRVQARYADLGAEWLLQPMLHGRLELIAGVTREPGLGHFLVFGLGGVHAEAFDQVAMLPVPVGQPDIASCVRASFVARLLDALDPTGNAQCCLVAVLSSLQVLICHHGARIAAIDINPLLLVGDKLVAVDALLVLDDTPHEATPLPLR